MNDGGIAWAGLHDLYSSAFFLSVRLLSQNRRRPSGHARWFERLLSKLQFELWIGDAAGIRTRRVRKQKTDRQDARLILQLLLEDRFPKIWISSGENRDLRQLLWHRHVAFAEYRAAKAITENRPTRVRPGH